MRIKTQWFQKGSKIINASNIKGKNHTYSKLINEAPQAVKQKPTNATLMQMTPLSSWWQENMRFRRSHPLKELIPLGILRLRKKSLGTASVPLAGSPSDLQHPSSRNFSRKKLALGNVQLWRFRKKSPGKGVLESLLQHAITVFRGEGMLTVHWSMAIWQPRRHSHSISRISWMRIGQRRPEDVMAYTQFGWSSFSKSEVFCEAIQA